MSRLTELSLQFLADAQCVDGDYRNRRSQTGHWEDRPTVEDCWGRAIWGLGTAASRAEADSVCRSATAQFERAARLRSPSPRATAYAVLGAAEMLGVRPGHRGALDLITDAAGRMVSRPEDPRWPWPQARLSYANAVLPEAMIAAGTVLDRPELLRHGLSLLSWLVERQTVDGHLSVTPVGGAGPREAGPGFDQQPIEVAALADACARASLVDDAPRWTDTVAAAVAWFLGDNDSRQVMWNPGTGGGLDGLHENGANQNQGAESTLALLSTLQHGRRLVMAAG
ncbi:MAG: glycosyltransferase [Acidimicrobiales bacterium]